MRSNRSRSGSRPKSVVENGEKSDEEKSNSGDHIDKESVRSGAVGSDDEKSVKDKSEDDDAARASRKGDSSDDERKSQSDNETTVEKDRKRKRAVISDESGSDAEVKKKPKKKLATVASGSDASDAEGERRKGASEGEDSDAEPGATAEALFGDADDISTDEEAAAEKAKKSDEDEEEQQEERRSRDAESDQERRVDDDDDEAAGEERALPVIEDDEGEKEEEPPPETRIDVEIPKISCDLGREIHFVKLPNFLSVETRPFDRETYEDEIDEEETLDEEGRARLKLKVENTIRWRQTFDKDGNLTKESNARFIRWSDGSMSLHLGSEIFDVYKQPLQGDHNHLFIRQGTGLQGQAVFRTKLTFRPHSTESFTHRKMTLSLADRSQKTSGIKVLSQVGWDPEQNKGQLIKKEEERLRASMRRESKQKRIRERGANRGLSTNYLEPDNREEEGSEDEGAISLAAIKSKYKKGGGSAKADKPPIYSSDEEGSDFEARRAKKLDKAKALKDSDDESEQSASGSEQGSGSSSGSGGEEQQNDKDEDQSGGSAGED